jgi:3-methyl-2-oxobutanoate hydroxymethyltransferase
VVPPQVATEISRRMSSLLLWSLGSDAGCDVQYLFAMDILGDHKGHMPRHSKVYRNFAATYDRLQQERVAALHEFKADVDSGAHPEPRHLVTMDDAELAVFRAGLPRT